MIESLPMILPRTFETLDETTCIESYESESDELYETKEFDFLLA